MRRALALAALCLLTARLPFWGFVHDETLDGPYRLVAVDVDEQMMVCRGYDGDCAGDFLPGATIFAAGADKSYLVMGRHPANNRAVTEYYYVIRTAAEGDGGEPRENVKGPFDEAQFAAEKKRLGLPEFSRVFDELE